MIAALVLSMLIAGQEAPAPKQDRPFIMPPKAADVTGDIEQVTLGPIYRSYYACVEHPLGQLGYAGDALGSDCMIQGGIDEKGGFARGYRTDGKTNADWYGWHAEVLAPVSGTVVGLYAKPDENAPGTMGKPPAAMLQIRTDAGVIVLMAHVTEVSVKRGDRVSAGQAVAKVGNNGMSRAPHIHVGAWREADAMPMQLRWDLRAMGKVFEAAGN